VVIVPLSVATVIRVPFSTLLPYTSLITPLVTVLVDVPLATILVGLGVNVIVPAGTAARIVSCWLVDVRTATASATLIVGVPFVVSLK
jgi:hypothetical protein